MASFNNSDKSDLWSTDLGQDFDAMFGVLFPDGTIPPIGDTYGIRRRLCDEFSYMFIAKRYRDPHYFWLLREGQHLKPEFLFTAMDFDVSSPPVSMALSVSSRLYLIPILR